MTQRDSKGRFVKGHTQNTGLIHSQETRNKISIKRKGFIFSKESKKKMSESHKGQVPWHKGKSEIYSEKTLKQMSEAKKGNKNHLGKKHSNKSKIKMSVSSKGQVPWMKGKKHTEESKRKLSVANAGNPPNSGSFHKGSTPWNKGTIGVMKSWNKGIGMSEGEKLKNKLESEKRSLKKYGFPFKMDPYSYLYALKSWSKKIRFDFNHQCQICNQSAELSHHILHKSKYPALSLNINNGIPLCKNCHTEVHGWNTSH